ncbi:hypothetical protein B566_EDAN013915 [Ephemera danica]|nr:hypothetical protein B566_EDAN013915 [Ephemera danica]
MKIIIIGAAVLLIFQAEAAEAYAELGTVHHHTLSNTNVGVQSRIIGGSLANPGEFPFQVAVLGSNYPDYAETFCGGVLLSSTSVLTAAHCLYDKIYFDVVLGTTRPLDPGSWGYQSVKTTAKSVHEQFNLTDGLRHDVGLLTLSPAIAFTRAGATLSENLLYVDVEIIDNQDCVNAYGPNNMPNSKLCISTQGGTEGPCHGDSGGPLFLTHNGELIVVGTVSFGAKQGCTSGYPDVYSRLSVYLDWIAEHGGPAVRP